MERPGLCRGRPAGARRQEQGKAPCSTPGPWGGRPRAGRGVGAREAAVCAFHCPPRPSATTAPSINVSVKRHRSYSHPAGENPRGSQGSRGGWGEALLPIGASLITTSHQLPPRAPDAGKLLCYPQNSAEFRSKRRQDRGAKPVPGALFLPGAPTAPDAAPTSFAAPWKPALQAQPRTMALPLGLQGLEPAGRPLGPAQSEL